MADVTTDKRVIRGIWDLREGKTKVVLSSLTGITRQGFEYAAAANELCAFSRIESLLTSVGFPCMPIYICGDRPSDYKKWDLVLLGGPRRNQLTGQTLEIVRNSLTYTFDTEELRLINMRDKRETYEPQLKHGSFSDYTLVAKFSNCLAQGSTVVVIAGCHDIGTLAGAYFLTDAHAMTKIAERFQEADFQIVLQVKGSFSGNPSEPLIETIHPVDLRVSSEIYFPCVPPRPLSDVPELASAIKYLLIGVGLTILCVISLRFLIVRPHFLLLPSLFASLTALFYLPVELWKKYRITMWNPAFWLIGFCTLSMCFITSTAASVIRLLLRI